MSRLCANRRAYVRRQDTAGNITPAGFVFAFSVASRPQRPRRPRASTVDGTDVAIQDTSGSGQAGQLLGPVRVPYPLRHRPRYVEINTLTGATRNYLAIFGEQLTSGTIFVDRYPHSGGFLVSRTTLSLNT